MSEKPNWVAKPTENGLWWFVGEDCGGDYSSVPMMLSVYGDHAEIATYIGGTLDRWHGLWCKVEMPEPPFDQLDW